MVPDRIRRSVPFPVRIASSDGSYSNVTSGVISKNRRGQPPSSPGLSSRWPLFDEVTGCRRQPVDARRLLVTSDSCHLLNRHAYHVGSLSADFQHDWYWTSSYQHTWKRTDVGLVFTVELTLSHGGQDRDADPTDVCGQPRL